MENQIQNLKKILFVDYKDIKNMFIDCQKDLYEEDKFIKKLKKDANDEVERIRKAELFMFNQENVLNTFTDV